MEKKLYDLVIDEELQKVAPPLAEHELEMLREDILEHGCKFPLIVWGDMIVDGHNRYSICKENDIPFAVEDMDFSNKTEAKMWIIRNQLGRRNLKDFQRCEMVLPLENELKEAAARRKKEAISAARTGNAKGKISPPSKKTRDVLAEIAGVSTFTLKEVKVLIVEADAQMLSKLRSGEIKIHTAYTQVKRKKENATTEKPDNFEAPQLEKCSKKQEQNEDASEVAKPDGVEHAPLVHMDHPMIVPAMRDKPQREPRPFQCVRDQVWFSMENMVRNLEIAMNWLRDEDQDKIPELLELLDAGFDRAEALITGQEDK